MNIQKYKYRLDASRLAPINSEDIDSIAIHHMAHPTAKINEVTGWHMDENKWSWIGYGYWIGFDGTVYECRGHKYLNAGVADNNKHIVSIGFQGDYSKNVAMPTAQFNSGVDVIRHLKTKLPNVRTIAGHNHWNPTDCPGRYFPLKEIIQKVEVINMDWKEILKEKTDSPERWIKAIESVVNFAKLDINIGDLEILQHLPILIEKIHT